MLGVSAHWRKAPYALLHHRSALLAVFAAALLAALASSSSPFVTTAAASEALKNKLADLSSFATGLEIRAGREAYGSESAADYARGSTTRAAATERLRLSLGHVGEPVFTTETSPLQVTGPKGDTTVVVMTRTDVLAHVKVLAQVSGPGVWLADISAHASGLKPGDYVRVNGLQSYEHPARPRLRVKGIYRALAHSADTDYWANLYQDIYPRCLDCGVPPPYAFLTRGALFQLLDGRQVGVESLIELQIDPKSVTLADARALNRKFDALRDGLRTSALGRNLGCAQQFVAKCSVISSLSAAVILADRNASAVTPAVTLLSNLGTAIALGVAAAAGIFLVRRRRGEAALLYARGEHVGLFAARTAVEALAPTLVGGAAGFGVAFTLTDLFAPSGSISGATLWSGLAHAAVAIALGLSLLVATGGVAFLRLFDTGSRGFGWTRFLVWEVVLAGIALGLYLRIRSGGAVTGGPSGSHAPTLAVFVFPLLLVAAVAGVGARLARLLLRMGSGRTARSRRPAVYLALRRLAAARGLVVVLAVVTAASLGAFFYVETLAASLHHTTIEKAYMATGSDAQALVQESQELPRSFAYPITKVQFANQTAATPDGTQIDVMLVDPVTMTRTLHWQSDWGPNPVRLLDELDRAPSEPLPVIVTADLRGEHSIVMAGEKFPMRTLGVVHAFPFMAQGIPLVITSNRALHDFEARTRVFGPLGVLGTYIWGKGPPRDVGRALTALEPTYPPSTINTFLHDPDVVLATRTFRFMRMIAIGAGVLALLGLLLYLQARQRSQAIASALARRMGFGRAAETFSLCLELAGIVCFAGAFGGVIAIVAAQPIVRRIDPLPEDPPGPIFTVPTGEILIAGGALVVLAIFAGVLTSWFARKADVSEALRVA